VIMAGLPTVTAGFSLSKAMSSKMVRSSANVAITNGWGQVDSSYFVDLRMVLKHRMTGKCGV
jgi:hypothetical protein